MNIFFLRHAQSLFNTGINTYNGGLSELGKYQASCLAGDYDLVIVSPLKRCMDTLEGSNIKYKELIITHLCREHKNNVNSLCDYFEGEIKTVETDDELTDRINKFIMLLKEKATSYNKILVISHGMFIGKMTGKYLGNAQLINVPIDTFF